MSKILSTVYSVDNSNLKWNLKKIRVIGILEQMTGTKSGKKGVYCISIHRFSGKEFRDTRDLLTF